MRIATIVTVVVTLVGCAKPTQVAEVGPAGAARRSIEAAHLALGVAFSTGDVLGLRQYVEPDAVVWLGPAGRLGGQDAILRHVQSVRAPHSRAELQELHVYAGVAYEVGIVSQADRHLARYSAIWKLGPDGNWRLYRLMAAGQLQAGR